MIPKSFARILLLRVGIRTSAWRHTERQAHHARIAKQAHELAVGGSGYRTLHRI
jgi:hypothetical protein